MIKNCQNCQKLTNLLKLSNVLTKAIVCVFERELQMEEVEWLVIDGDVLLRMLLPTLSLIHHLNLLTISAIFLTFPHPLTPPMAAKT